MKKHGFSIIELMVVIVIMGVLAAVAVPKLFGFMAKSKASELPIAAGTYIKLQDSYIHEHSRSGNWQEIGYKSPAGNSTGKANSSTFEYDASQSTYNWTATSLVTLNDCTKGSTWFINYKAGSAPHHIVYWASSDNLIHCLNALTPTFKNLSTTATAITTAGGE